MEEEHSPLPLGAQFGPYQILDRLGAGGMGEVYRARDIRLDRTVAIKLLSASLAGRSDFRQRFEREARAISAMNHPHICSLYDVGEQDGVAYLVMEHVEGETLAARLRKGPLALDQVLIYGAQIADALAAAHARGIIHRDLKPGNLMVTRSGIKVLDFGLAKFETQPRGQEAPTETLTVSHAIVGTLAYMAPEQLAGQECDARADLYALGLLLYEMATGQRAEPPVASGTLPAPLERTVNKCLQRDRDLRWQSARDLCDELRWIGEGSAASSVATGGHRRWRKWAVAAAVLAAGAAGYSLRPSRGPSEQPVLRAMIDLPPGIAVVGPDELGMTLSPDGKMLAFAASQDEDWYLWVQRLDTGDTTRLDAARRGYYPFWSPDSRYVGFFAEGKLKKVLATGGPAATICDALLGRGATWSDGDDIVFCPTISTHLFQVPAAGGEPRPVTQLDASRREDAHYWPQFLPDGRHFLYLARSLDFAKSAIRVGSLDAGFQPVTVVPTVAQPAYAQPTAGKGSLFFVREGALMAQAFDARRFALEGEPAVLVPAVSFNSGYGPVRFTVSRTGVAAFTPVPSDHLRFLNREGNETGDAGTPAAYYAVALAPNDRSVAASIVDPRTGTQGIWLLDFARGNASRFTFDGQFAIYPVWSADGGAIVYGKAPPSPYNLFRKRTSGTAGDERLLPPTSGPRSATDWSRDGRFLLYEESTTTETKSDLWVLEAPLSEVSRLKPERYLAGPFNETQGHFSPDGRWVAYVCDETGVNEVYLQTFPKPGTRLQISTGGGAQPRWRGDGKELYYVGRKGALMAVALSISGGAMQAGIPRRLFTNAALSMDRQADYDATADGQRFLTVIHSGYPIHILLNWPAAIGR